MAIAQNGQGSIFYKCPHRGLECAQSARGTKGLSQAAVLGPSLLSREEQLQRAIPKQLAESNVKTLNSTTRHRETTPTATIAKLSDDRRKLLELYYAEKISTEGFQREETRLTAAIEVARARAVDARIEERVKSDLEHRFDEVATILKNLDIEEVWRCADETEKRILVEGLVEWVTIFPDHLEVTVVGALALNFLYSEASWGRRLMVSETVVSESRRQQSNGALTTGP